MLWPSELAGVERTRRATDRPSGSGWAPRAKLMLRDDALGPRNDGPEVVVGATCIAGMMSRKGRCEQVEMYSSCSPDAGKWTAQRPMVSSGHDEWLAVK